MRLHTESPYGVPLYGYCHIRTFAESIPSQQVKDISIPPGFIYGYVRPEKMKNDRAIALRLKSTARLRTAIATGPVPLRLFHRTL